MKPEPRACPEAGELDAFASDALPAERARHVAVHVAHCADCCAAAQDARESGLYGRMLRDWRARMSPEERRRTIDRATRRIVDAAGPDSGSRAGGGSAS